MKKQYIVALLLMLGLSVVGTMAFTSGTAGVTTFAPVTVTDTGAENIERVLILPHTQPNGVKLLITFDAAVDKWIGHVQVQSSGSDLLVNTGETYAITLPAAADTKTAAWNSTLGMVRLETEDTDLSDGYTTITVTLTKSSLWTNGDGIVILTETFATHTP